MINNTLYVEKYRPQTITDFVGNDNIINTFTKYINSKDIPHLLLFGRAGTGKTTLAKLLVKEIQCDYLYINASDENDIETVRTKIKRFAMSVSTSNIKIIILDEADYLTPNAQAALRSLMETTSRYTRFILTSNYQNRIIDPLGSRCTSFEIRPLLKSSAAARVATILDAENVSFEPEDLVPIINSHFPDLRKIINEVQRCVVNGKLSVDQQTIIESDYRLKIIEILKSNDNNKFETIRKIILDNQIREFTDMYRILFENIDDICEAKGNIGDAILIIADQQYRDAFVVDKEITFMATLIRLLEIL